MELPQSVLTSLSHLSVLPSGTHGTITEGSVSVILGEMSGATAEKSLHKIFGADDLPSGKFAFSALSSALVEASRIGATGEEFKEFLSEIFSASSSPSSLKKSEIAEVAEVYARKRNALMSALSASCFASERIVDVKWRLDHVVRGRHLEKIGDPRVFVTLVTEKEDGMTGKVEFCCDQAQLHDLVAKFADAVKQPSRVEESA